MRKTCIFTLTLCLNTALLTAQDITGRWRSADSTRTYNIYSRGDTLEAVLEKSSRKLDKPGTMILTLLQKKKNGRYVGFIHAGDDGMTTVAVLKMQSPDNNILSLRLRRFGPAVTIKWYRETI